MYNSRVCAQMIAEFGHDGPALINIACKIDELGGRQFSWFVKLGIVCPIFCGQGDEFPSIRQLVEELQICCYSVACGVFPPFLIHLPPPPNIPTTYHRAHSLSNPQFKQSRETALLRTLKILSSHQFLLMHVD
jgi:hypothetical protein